jgi:hypothetical protein
MSRSVLSLLSYASSKPQRRKALYSFHMCSHLATHLQRIFTMFTIYITDTFTLSFNSIAEFNYYLEINNVQPI